MARTRTIRDEDLLLAARAAFVEKGFACPTKEIARRARVSEGVLFQRYSTKEELFFAAMAPPQADLADLLGVADGSLEHLEAIGLRMLRYFQDAVPVLLPLVSHPAFKFEEFAMRNPESPLVTMRRDVMGYFNAIGAVDPAASSLLLMTSVYGLAMFERLGAHGGQMPPQFVRRMLERIWKTCEIPVPKAKVKSATSQGPKSS
jgi:AcrR family transcriptional regulator